MNPTSITTDAFHGRQQQLNQVIERIKKQNPGIDHDRAWFLAKNKDAEGKRIMEEMANADLERNRQAGIVEEHVPSPEAQRAAAIAAKTAELKATGMSYDDAWNLAKNLPEHQR